jgi:hypothetical protein
VGISTKKLPSNEINAFKTDTELEENKRIITNDINVAISKFRQGNYKKMVIPSIGTGLANLQEKAPLTWQHLQTELNRLESTLKDIKDIKDNRDFSIAEGTMPM